MSVDHVLRLTVRFRVGAFQREADVSVPASSSLAEAIPEIVSLVGAPRISRPWQARTAGGTSLDTGVALHHTPLEQGAVVVLTPRHVTPPAVVRDAAEALAEVGPDLSPQGLAAAGALVGVGMVFALVVTVAPFSLAAGAAVTAAVSLLVLRPGLRSLALPTVLLAAGAAAAAVLEVTRPEELSAPPTWGWAALVGVAAGAVALGALVVLRWAGPRTAAGVATVLAGATVAGAGAFLPAHLTPPGVASAALVATAGVVWVGQLPGVAVRSAGLRVPRLPTAGQDLGVADELPTDTTDRARRALRLHEGSAVGAAFLLVPTLLFLGYGGGVTAQALCTAVAGAVLLHAVRHRQTVAARAWAGVGLAACAGAVLAAPTPGHPVQWVVAGVVAGACLSAPLWAQRVPLLEPTTLVWWERAESLAVAASLPLSAHLAGFFLLIRGLG